jgi:hypothetical protein
MMNPSTGLGPIALASAGLVNLAEASKSSRNIIFSAALCVVAVLAIQLARQANQLSGGTNALVLRTLAAAYAEAGQFGKAIESARTAMQLRRSQGDDSLAPELQQQIALYELGVALS